MVGDVYNYNSLRIYIMSGEKRIIISFVSREEYCSWIEKGMRIGASVIFDYESRKLVKFF